MLFTLANWPVQFPGGPLLNTYCFDRDRDWGDMSTPSHPNPLFPLQPWLLTTMTREIGQSRCHRHHHHHSPASSLTPLFSFYTFKRQFILSAAVNLIGGSSKFAHISGFIRDLLCWLPIQQQIQLKTLSLMHNCSLSLGWLQLNHFALGSLPYLEGPPCDLPSWSYGYSVHALCAGALRMFAPQLGTVFHSPSTWNYYPSNLSSCGNTLRLSCLLLLMPVESAADLSDAIQIFDNITLL